MLTVVFNTNEGNGNSINCQFHNFLSIFILDFKSFHLLLQKNVKRNTVRATYLANGISTY